MIRYSHNQRGFTLIELMLAMAGIAFLLLFVVFAITHATNLYSKGVAIRQINQVGRQTGEEIARQIRYGGEPTIMTVKNRLCINGKSYVWNNANTPASELNVDDSASSSPIGFRQLNGTSYCSDPNLRIPASSPELLGNIAKLMRMSVSEPISGTGVYEIEMVFGTALAQPVLEPVSQRYQCSPSDGQYCAVGEFKLVVYARGDVDAQ